MKWPFTDLERANEEITMLRKQIAELTQKIEEAETVTKELEAAVNTHVMEYHELRDKYTQVIGKIMELMEKYGGQDGRNQN